MLLLSKWFWFRLAAFTHLIGGTLSSPFECYYCDDEAGRCPEKRKDFNIRCGDNPGDACWTLSPKDDLSKMQLMVCVNDSLMKNTSSVMDKCVKVKGSDLQPKIEQPLKDLIEALEAPAEDEERKAAVATKRRMINSLKRLGKLDMEEGGKERYAVEDDSIYAICACNKEKCYVDFKTNQTKYESGSGIAAAVTMTKLVFWSSVVVFLAQSMHGF